MRPFFPSPTTIQWSFPGMLAHLINNLRAVGHTGKRGAPTQQTFPGPLGTGQVKGSKFSWVSITKHFFSGTQEQNIPGQEILKIHPVFGAKLETCSWGSEGNARKTIFHFPYDLQSAIREGFSVQYPIFPAELSKLKLVSFRFPTSACALPLSPWLNLKAIF